MHAPVISCSILLAITMAACSGDSATGVVVDDCPLLVGGTPTFASATSAGRWNTITQGIVSRREQGPLGIARTFALVSVAQYDAVVAAQQATRNGTHQSQAGAASAAAATVLRTVYPVEQPTIDAQLAADAVAVSPSASSNCSAQFTAGTATGNRIGTAVLARAASMAAPPSGLVRCRRAPASGSVHRHQRSRCRRSGAASRRG